jgi:HKD family nuclease
VRPSSKDRRAHQPEIANRIIQWLVSEPGTKGAVAEGDGVVVPPEELHAIRPVTGDPAHDRDIPRPLVPLSAAALLVNAGGEPALAHALANEIPSADSIDLLWAFVRWHGLRVLTDPLTAHCRGKPLRVITTVYTGSTERKALDWLVNLGAQVKVSYDTQSTRLHAKAWLFRRETGYSTAYIGSSNLSKSALLDGVEWKVRLSEVEDLWELLPLLDTAERFRRSRHSATVRRSLGAGGGRDRHRGAWPNSLASSGSNTGLSPLRPACRYLESAPAEVARANEALLPGRCATTKQRQLAPAAGDQRSAVVSSARASVTGAGSRPWPSHACSEQHSRYFLRQRPSVARRSRLARPTRSRCSTARPTGWSIAPSPIPRR